jgi:hypothetical protein
MTDPFKTYIQTLQADLGRGNASEHTHRPALKTLLESLGERLTATNEPKQVTDCGKPDIAVYQGPVLLGYLETKDVGVNLDTEERGPQLKRYREALPNLILTDYLEFRWYVNGERRAVASLGTVEQDGKVKARKEALAVVGDFLAQFLALKLPLIGTAKELALRMARLAGLLHNAALKTLEMEPATGTLKGWLAAFEKTLVPNLSPEEFSDMYAQTLTYGLFAAKVSMGAGQELRRDTAAGLLPETNPFLKRLFYHLAGPEVPPTVSWVVDDMVSLLNAADLEAVMADFGRGSLEKDPVVHFYETFLAAYDPEKRKVRGVYYTPEPVVSYIVRAIDYLLKERFGRSWGLADRNTLILDPACGTGTFLHSVIALIYDTLCAQGQAGGWASYVSQSLLPRIFGFELLMAPYAVAHLKLGLLLQEKGFNFPPGQRLGVYLTNTLDEGFKKAEVLPLAGFITEESNSAAKIKKEDPIEVVLGNPPYAVHSANASMQQIPDPVTGKTKAERTWIGSCIEDYKQVDGKPLGEKNSKALQDDYVKFLRWGQWRITQTGRGILAMITNHGYLDGPTFRGMRQQLMQTFSEIYLLNLHGNARKKEVCPDGSKDENVFDIQQGVAIGLFVKGPNSPGPAKVYFADLWGTREGKYQTLAQMEVITTPWRELQPQSPFYLFAPQDTALEHEFKTFWNVMDIFPVNSTGVKTHRDHFVFDFEYEKLLERIASFRNLSVPNDKIATDYDLKDTRDWKLNINRNSLAKLADWEQYFTKALYRPFDIRYYYHHEYVVELPRDEIMRHMLAGANIALCASRSVEVGSWEHVFCSVLIIQNHTLSLKEANYLFPVFLYPQGLFEQGQKTPNLNPKFLEDLAGRLGLTFAPEGRGDLESTFGPEDVFSYAYAVFHSPTYRQRYAEFLKMDFPRLPLTGNKDLFKALAGLGAELVSLHLMESPRLGTLITKFPVPGSQRVEEVRYQDTARRVYINSEQYFEGVPPEVWAFTIGGYQVCHKWLKDRKGRTLTFEDLHHYQKIIVALAETIRLMEEIDAVILAHGGWPLDPP